MFRRVQRFAKSPAGKRVIAWLAPIVVGWIMQKLSSGSKSQSSTGRKSVKNKAK